MVELTNVHYFLCSSYHPIIRTYHPVNLHHYTMPLLEIVPVQWSELELILVGDEQAVVL